MPLDRVLLFTSSLGGGGAEKQLTIIASYLARQGIEVTVAVVKGQGEFEHLLDPRVRLVVLECKTHLSSDWLRVAASTKALADLIVTIRPDVAFSSLPNPNATLLRAVGRIAQKPRVVVSIRNNLYPSVKGIKAKIVANWVRFNIARHYARADAIIFISKGIMTGLSRLKPELRARSTCIYNAALPENLDSLLAEPPPESVRFLRGYKFVACGRLTEQKDYPTMLHAFAKVAATVSSEVSLLVVGDGRLKSELTQLASRLDISERVHFLGFHENPYPIMKASDCFVLSSRWEGFGNVVVEALACGIPVVCADCPSGPGEILENGRYGKLVEPGNSGALASAMLEAMQDEQAKQIASVVGPQRARTFSMESVGSQYHALFASLADCEPVAN